MVNKNNNGFTLIELLIVLVIIGIIIAVAILALGSFGQQREIREASKKISFLIPLAQEKAIIQSTTLGLKATGNSYKFFYFKIDPASKEDSWQLIKDNSLLRMRAIPRNIELKTIIKGGKTKMITFFPDGNTTPFTIYIGTKDELPSYKITGKANGTIKLLEIENSS